MNFSNLKEWFIETEKLYPLGFTDDHLHFAFGLFVLILIYYFISPIIRWLMDLKWNKVLTYMVGSFLLLFICTFIELYQGIKGTGNMQFSDLASSIFGIFAFGIVLFISHLMSAFVHHLKQKQKKNVPQQQKNA
jgi:hypothetical protein